MRLANKRLNFYETNTAACTGIVSKMVFLSEHVDDPDLLRVILEVKQSADRMRIRNIQEMNQEKGII